MLAREYLQEIRAINIAIHNKQRQLIQLEYIIGASGISYSPDKVQSSPRQDGLEMAVINNLEKRDKIMREIQNSINTMIEMQNKAVDLINQIESERQKEILMLRYIELRSWSDIMDIRQVDDISSMHKLHNRAIQSLQKVMDKEGVS